jgi:hypothetical protein
MGTFALAICLNPNVSWSTRAFATVITGQVTAAPQSNQIEIAHHLYRVKANSAAAKALANFYVGQTVDAIMDGPPGAPADEIINLTIHSAS